MKRTLLASMLFLAVISGGAQAGLIFHTSEATFDAAAPGLATQTFAAATTPTGGVNTMGNPLDSGTNNGLFATGDILAGLSISATEAKAAKLLGMPDLADFSPPTVPQGKN